MTGTSDLASATSAVFSIVATGRLLSDQSKRVGVTRRTVGDVAQLDDGRLVARVGLQCRDGSTAYASQDYDPSIPADQVLFPVPIDPAALVSAPDIEPDKYNRMGPSAEDDELARFRSEWPSIAKRLGLVDVEAARFFDPGVVYYEKQFRRTNCFLICDVVREFVTRHVAGFHGLYKNHVCEPVSQSQLFELDRMPVDIQNRAAIIGRSGVVRSRYVLGDEYHALISNPWGLPGRRRAVLDVVTVLGRSSTRTLCTFGIIVD